MIEIDHLPTYGLSVQECGARGDGISDDGPAIQRALNAGKRLVTIPYGVYRVGQALRIGSYTHLRVHPRARLYLADGAGVDNDTHLVTNLHHDRGDTDILIEGGIWDGNNLANPRGPDSPGSYTGVLTNFRNVTGLTLRSLTLRDPESYYVRLTQIRGFLVEHIRFEAPHLRPNQDGIHIAGFCEDGIVRHIMGSGPAVPNDDVVAFSADDALGRAQNLGKLNGPIRRIRVEDLSADDCHTFVRLLSIVSPVEDICVEGVRGGCQVCAVNADGCRECRVQVFDPLDPAFADGVGQMARITLRDFHVWKSRAGNHKPVLDLRTQGTDFTLERFQRDQDHDAELGSRSEQGLAAPTMRLGEFTPCRAILAGLNSTRLGALVGASSLSVADVSKLSSPVSSATYRIACELQREGALLLAEGGFDTLQVNPTDPGV